METGKEAPCRRYYQEKNNMYSVSDLELLKHAKRWSDEKFGNELKGVDAMKCEGMDPIEIHEKDDIMSSHPRTTWWNRPQWHRDPVNYFYAPYNKDFLNYYRKLMGGKAPPSLLNPFAVISRWYRIMRDGTYSTTTERLNQVQDAIEAQEQVAPSANPEAMPELARLLSNQAVKLRIAYRNDWKEFWRNVKPLPHWQTPRGLAEPDPAVLVRPSTKMPFFRDVWMGSSAIEDLLYRVKQAQDHPFWHPLHYVKVFATSPLAAWSSKYWIDHTIKLRENERRTGTQPGMMDRAKLDLFYDHTPGWNHATHTWHHGRRLSALRQIQEEAELKARFPEPISEVKRPEAYPRHMQPYFQWRAFPDPIYSHFANVDAVSVIKADSMMLDTDDVYQSTEHIDSPLKHSPTPRPARLHWLYTSYPVTAQKIYQGTPLPGASAMIPNLQKEKEQIIPMTEPGSLQHAINRSQGKATNPLETQQALHQHLSKITPWQNFNARSPRIRMMRSVWSFIRNGPTHNDGSTVLSRSLRFLSFYRTLSKEEKITVSDAAKEVASGVSHTVTARKRALQRQLGMSDEKLRYMQQFYLEKDNAKRTPPIEDQSRTAADQSAYSGYSSKVAKHQSKTSSSSKGSRSYTTSATSSRGHFFTKPWTLSRRQYSLQASSDTNSDPTYVELSGMFGGGGRGRKVDVTPLHSRSSAAYSPEFYEERAYNDSIMQAAAKAASGSSFTDEEIYALPRRRFKSEQRTVIPMGARETYFMSQGRIDSPEAPFPVIDASVYGRTGLPTSLSDRISPKSSFSEAVWGISKAFGRVVSNIVRNTMDEYVFRKSVHGNTLEEDMSKVIKWQTKMSKDAFWQRYQHDMLSKARSIYSSLPQLTPTLNILFETTHPRNDASWVHLDPASKDTVLGLSGESGALMEKDAILGYVLAQLSTLPNIPHAGPGHEDRFLAYRRAWEEHLARGSPSSASHPALQHLWRAPTLHQRDWSEALKRYFTLKTRSGGRSLAEEKQYMFDNVLEDLIGAAAEQENTLRQARKPLEGIPGMEDDSSPVRRDSQGVIIGLKDPAAIWNDPLVNHHDPESWKAMREEFAILDMEIHQNQMKEIERELERRKLKNPFAEVSDFERMLFHVQPYVDRMMAHPMDPKARSFYIMKLERLTEDPILNADWRPASEDEFYWWSSFQELESDVPYLDLVDNWRRPSPPVIDDNPSSLSDILLQLGHPDALKTDDSFHNLYKAHIDHPFLYVKSDGTFVDLNADGMMDPLMSLAKGIAPSNDHVHSQSAKSPFKHLRELLNAEPLFLAKSWIRTLAHIRYQKEVKQTWNPLADDADLPTLIAQLEARLSEAKNVRDSESSRGLNPDAAADQEYETMRDLVAGLSSDLKLQSSDHDQASSLSSLPSLEASGLSASDFYTMGGMVAALDPNCKNFVPPPMHLNDSYIDAASSPASSLEQLLAAMQQERDNYETKVEALLASSLPKPEVSKYNPYLYMPYEPIPRSRALSTRWRGTEPLILHAPMMPDHIAAGLMQYMVSLKRNLANPDLHERLQGWLSVRPELVPYIAKLSNYNERFVNAVLRDEPLPYGEDIEKTFFHWTVSDYVQHYTGTGFIEDLRLDQLMALSDLHILLFGNDSEKALLKRKRRDLQRAALTILEQKIAGTKLADSVSTCPTLIASDLGGEERLEYSLSQRIRNTLDLIGREHEGSEGENYRPLVVSDTPKEEFIEGEVGQKEYDDFVYGALEPEYHHLGHARAAIERYRHEHEMYDDPGPNADYSNVQAGLPAGGFGDLPAPHLIRVRKGTDANDNPASNKGAELAYIEQEQDYESHAALPSEEENIAILKARFLQHPSTSSKSSSSPLIASAASQTPIPKDMLPLAGLDPNDWLNPVTAQEMTLQRLHLLPFEPEKRSTHGNYPYSWMDEHSSEDRSYSSLQTRSNKLASILAGRPYITMEDLLTLPLKPDDDALAEQDEGVKLARRVGDPELVREARYLFSLRGADVNNHDDERTIRLLEFHFLKHQIPGFPRPELPPRVVMPPEYQNSVALRAPHFMKETIEAQAWIRNRYSSWLGQDPSASTFNLVTALDPDHAYDGPGSMTLNERLAVSGAAARKGMVSQRLPFTQARIAVPDPDTVWGPTKKSFFDLEQELRFQLALSVPSDVEQLLQDEKANFIKDLEAQLIAYKAMEKASLERQAATASQKLEAVESRLDMLEKEMSSSDGVEMTVDENGLPIHTETFLEQIAKERDQLLQEREQLKQHSVEIMAARYAPEPTDDSWLRLQEALENLKEMSAQYQSVVKQAEDAKEQLEIVEKVPEPGTPEAAGLVTVEPAEEDEEVVETGLEKSPEQENYDERVKSIKERREKQEKKEEQAAAEEDEDAPRNKKKRFNRRKHIAAEAQYTNLPEGYMPEGFKRQRGPKRGFLANRLSPPKELNLIHLPWLNHKKFGSLPEDMRIWRKSYPELNRLEWQLMMAHQVQFFCAQILNGTPQGVRLSCHFDVIPMIENFYREVFPKFVLLGTTPPFCAEQRWAPRESDEAFTSASIWVVPIIYSTEFEYDLINQVKFRPDLQSIRANRTFVGNIFLVVQSAPELNFHVVDFRVDLDIPDLPHPVHPEQAYTPGPDIWARRNVDERLVTAPYMNVFSPSTKPNSYPEDGYKRATPTPARTSDDHPSGKIPKMGSGGRRRKRL